MFVVAFYCLITLLILYAKYNFYLYILYKVYSIGSYFIFFDIDYYIRSYNAETKYSDYYTIPNLLIKVKYTKKELNDIFFSYNNYNLIPSSKNKAFFLLAL